MHQSICLCRRRRAARRRLPCWRRRRGTRPGPRGRAATIRSARSTRSRSPAPIDVNVATGGKAAVTRQGRIQTCSTKPTSWSRAIRSRSCPRSIRASAGAGRTARRCSPSTPRASRRGDRRIGRNQRRQGRPGDFEGDVAGSGDLRLGSVGRREGQAGDCRIGRCQRRGQGRQRRLLDRRIGRHRRQGLASRTADVSIAGSGNVAANASDSADVSIMGSGDVEITGGAKCKVSKAGSGDVSCG